MEPCQEICAQNAKQFVDNGSYQKFITESQGSVGKAYDLDMDSTKVTCAAALLIEVLKRLFAHPCNRPIKRTNADVRPLAEKVVAVHKDVKRKRNRPKSMFEVVVTKDAIPIRMTTTTAIRRRVTQRLNWSRSRKLKRPFLSHWTPKVSVICRMNWHDNFIRKCFCTSCMPFLYWQLSLQTTVTISTVDRPIPIRSIVEVIHAKPSTGALECTGQNKWLAGGYSIVWERAQGKPCHFRREGILSS